jgi:hypothetical protein
MAFIGRRGWINIAREETPGVPVPPGDIYLPYLECSLMEKIEVIPEVQVRGVRDEQGEGSVIGKKWGEGKIKVDLDAHYAPILLGLAMGDFGTPQDLGGGVYEHTFTRKSSNVPATASVIFDRVVDRRLFSYLVVDSAELSVSEKFAELEVNCLSRFPVATTSGTLTAVSGTLFSFRNASVRMGATLSEAETATPLKVTELNLSIDNNSDIIFTLGSDEVSSIVTKNFNVSGGFTLIFESTDQRDIFANLTKKALIISLEGGDLGGGYKELIKFRIPKIRIEEWSPDLSPDDIASEEINFVAEYSLADAKTMDIVVRNTRPSY